MTVYLLWHIGHQNEAGEGGATLHVDAGSVYLDEQDGDDAKLLGVYSSQARAEARMRQARLLPGFADEPECFSVDEHVVDADGWTEGFVRVPITPEPEPDAEPAPAPEAAPAPGER